METGLDFGTATGLSTQDIRLTVAKIIRVAFGLLGVVAIGIVLAGGVMWMTSGGDEEKLTKAKKILTNGVIGLTIMLLSFAITQFVLSRLTSALGGGGVQIATEGGGGTLPPGALGGGCVDPGGTVPFVCGVSPLSGGVGSYVTIRGYRFGLFTPGTSKVQIGVADAPIVSCQGSPNWGENLIVVEVPQLDTGRSYPVTVTSPGGTSSNPRSLNVTADPLGPQIACITPGDAPEGIGIAIIGKLFGTTAGTVRFAGNVTATTSAWEDAGITGVVPVGAQSGAVTVTQGERTSNGYPFTVTCTTGSQCSASNCCTQGQCVEASACAPGGPPSTVGASCDGDAIAPACQPIACGGGLRCDLTSCTCQEGPTITAVSPQTLVSTTDGTAYRRAEDVPTGTQTVTAPNGAAGNYLTIRGLGFGDAVCSNDATKRCSRNADCGDGGTCTGLGRVIFLGSDGATDDQVAQLASCASAWSDTEVIAVVPAGAAVGPIRIESQDPAFFDQTDDARGTAIEHFRLNTTTRPGLCAITPPSATVGATVALAGAQFGATKGAEDAARFGDQSATITAWGAAAISATVPAIAEGSVEVRVRNDGELSNGVTFTRAPEPREPLIQEIIPDRGGGGQYATIRGQNFGVAIGKVMFKRGSDEYEIRPRFPDQCSLSWWKGNEITIRIPANMGEWGPPAPPADFNALGAYEVRVHARDGNAFRASNAVTFNVTTDQPTPGICAIIPSSGPARTSVQLIGERFGGAVGALRFFDGIAAAIGDGSADRAGNFQWADGLVRGVLVPATARTGVVRLWQTGQLPDRDDDPAAPGLQGNRGSNPVTFEVKDCRAGGEASCASAQVCCGNGTCVANAAQCVTGPNRGSFQWTFATGIVPKMPRVVESCSAFSPSPWDSQGQGGSACVNANIRVQFSTSMAKLPGAPDASPLALDAAGADEGIWVFRCGAGTNVAAAAGGTFEAADALTGWRVVEDPSDATPLVSAHLSASRPDALPAGQAHGGSHVLLLEKRQPSATDNDPSNTEPRTTDLPRDAPVDRHYFAIQAPNSLMTDTAGTTYTARVFVKGANPNQNPNMRAGIVVGRAGGPRPTDAGWWQQVANEVTINGTWQELAVSATFDSGKNSRASLDAQGNPTGTPTPGFVRLYVTGPPTGESPNPAVDDYTVQFDDLEVVRQGDPCAVREEVPGITVEPVTGSGGRLQLENNVITVSPPAGRWQPGTWYEVVLDGDDTPAGAGNAFRSAGSPQLRLDGDKDGQEGGNYRFRFRTRDSADACAVQQVLVSPTDATATQPGPARGDLTTTASLPGLVHLRADGIGDPAACFLLNTSGMPWSWATTPETNPLVSPYVSVDAGGGRWCIPSTDDCGVITCATATDCPGGVACTNQRCAVDFCTDHRCQRPVGGQNIFANTATARALKETPVSPVGVSQPVEVQATVTAATPRVGESHVTVRFEKPRVVTVYPTAACQQACPNSRIIAVTNVDILPASLTPANVRLHECDQENCRRGELTSVGGVAATACASGSGTAGDCSRRIGTDAQIVLAIPAAYQNGQLKVNQSYRLILTGGATGVRSAWDVPLDQLNYADNDTGTVDAYSWTFRTRTEPCGVSRVELTPNPLVFQAVGQRATVTAVPLSAPDQCSPAGQPLDAEVLPWVWDVVNASGDVADFTAVNVAGAFAVPGPAQLTQTTRVAGPTCSAQCLRPGSRRVPGICGNGVLETQAEECERTTDLDGDGNNDFASWCDARTCLRKGASPAPNGTCGDGDVDAGEECDGGKRCAAGGPRTGEVCAADADCTVTADGVTASSACTFVFPAWCDPGTCLRKGSGFGSVCGNGSPATPIAAAGDGEDCDDGNTTSGDGCSSRCLLEGTPRRYDATQAPEGILARCGDGVVADGQGGRPDGGEECDPGAVNRAAWATARCDYDRCVKIGAEPITVPDGTCGNGTLQAGEQCDDGAVGSCSAASGARAGNPCATAADCGDGGACEDRQPVGGDGCSADCLLEGSSITWRNAVTGNPQPSMCGDGAIPSYDGGRSSGGEACDAGNPAAPPDPLQIIQALGRAPANATGVQETNVTANAGAPAPGQGMVRLVCGHQSDAECNFPDADPPIVPGVYGIDRAGCCQRRPVIASQIPPNSSPPATGVCRNAQITVRFNQLMDPGSVGVVTDVATGAATRRGAILERQDGAAWQEVPATPTLAAVLSGHATVSELRFGLTSALAASTTYRVRILDASDDAASQQRSIRSADGVRLRDDPGNTWIFETSPQVCLMSRVDVQPPSYLLQRRESRAPLEVTTWALAPGGEQQIGEVPGYRWEYAWSSTAENIATRVATPPPAGEDPQYPCGDSQRCAFKPAEPAKNGDAFGRATVTITENIFSPTCEQDSACGTGRRCTDHGANGRHCTNEMFADSASLRALICENPWPAVTNPATWSPFPASDDLSPQAALLRTEHLSIAYCRDQGDRKVCRLSGPENPESPTDARVCASDNDCASIAGAKCLPALRDDLPAFSDVVAKQYASPVDGLRKEFFFLPREAVAGTTAAYCSVSGERCDPSLAGVCPPGEFCRTGQDAIGLRIYENAEHVGAARWFQSQGFTDATTPIEADGYRGVRAGRSTYLNVANIGSVFTNLLVLSFNDGAVPETQEILTQALDGIRFTDTLTEGNTRTCAAVGRCSQGDAPCRIAADCTGTGNTCDLTRLVACISDRECRVGATAGTCAAPKDKLARDVRRLEDLNEIRLAIEEYGQGQRRCSVTPKTCDPAASAGSDAGCPANETCLLPSPDLSAGTFVPGFTTSLWPSWVAELGRVLGVALPVDPLNAFGPGPCGERRCGGAVGAPICTNDANCASQVDSDRKTCATFDPETCWNQQQGTYAAPPGSYLYEYQRQPTGSWIVRGGFEYIEPATAPRNLLPDLQPEVGVQPFPVNMSATTGGVPSQAYSATGRCGDGAVALAQGEQCDPPGSTGVPTGQSGSCTTADGRTGSQFWTCQQNCTWSLPSACGALCGNFVVDSGEACDVGPQGGRVPPGHPVEAVIPGISYLGQCSIGGVVTPQPCRLNTQCALGICLVTAATRVNTQYACSATCAWSGGRCGDGVVQAGYGESCDLLNGITVVATSNIAVTPSQSSAAKQYSCTPSTNPNPCKGIGGFCGDGVVQDGGMDTKACRSTAGQWGKEPCATDVDCSSGETCAVRVRRSSLNRSEQCDGDEVRSCIAGAGELRTPAAIAGGGTLTSGSLPWRTTTGEGRIRFDGIVIRNQGGANGSMRITLETSNDPGNLANLTRDQIEAAMSSGTTINDYNPSGAQGGVGIYHRLRIETRPAGGSWVTHGTVWALASNAHQITSAVLGGIPSGTRDLRIVWDNDWASPTRDSNLLLHRVTIEGVQTRSCGTTGAAATCRVANAAGAAINATATGAIAAELGWSACQAVSAQCGNGTVDAGEECDDGGKGRCANELTKVCASAAECTGGAACERDLDLCTSECKRNVCGDARQLAATCTAGHASKIGLPCTSNTQCGQNGLCATEQCDLGTSNWRAACAGATAAARATDLRCVPNAICEYGRQCNYCVIGSCSVATKQGGFCGDRVKNGPEACDVVAGTNQCESLSGDPRTQCEQGVSAILTPGGTCTGLSGTSLTRCQTAWSRQICNAACDAMCPPASTAAPLRFTGTTTPTEAQFNAAPAGQTKNVQVDACRLLDAFKYDVELGSGVDVWPVPVSIVVVTDRSGSMARDVVADCNGNGVSNVAGTCSGGDRPGEACTHDDECFGTPNGDCVNETINDDRDSRMRCTKNAIRGNGALLDKLAVARDPGDVRVALVSYGTAVQTDSELRDVANDGERDQLKTAVENYGPNLVGTATHLAIERAAAILDADASAQTKVIILLSDGIANDAAATTAAAGAFKAPGGHRYLFTIAYPIPRAGMSGWASGSSFTFSGADLEAFYDQIVGAIAGVSVIILPGGGGEDPHATTYVSRTQTGVRVSAGDELAEMCAANGQPTTYRIRVKFRPRPGATNTWVKLRNPSALVCTGPPWAQ